MLRLDRQLIGRFLRTLLSGGLRLARQSLRLRGLLILAGIFVCGYALAILWYVQSLPDIGIRSAFTPVIKHFYPKYLRHADSDLSPRPDDVVVGVGSRKVRNWPDLLWAPITLHDQVEAGALDVPELKRHDFATPEITRLGLCRDGHELLVRVRFRREMTAAHSEQTFRCWLVLGGLPVGELIPSVLWFFVKLVLFVVGALVFWKRPGDRSATLFFCLCIVTLGAYMGGYHWSHIVTQPVLILGFMVCAVLLPVVSLHFNLVFPRPKLFLQRCPRRTLLAIYGLPLLFLTALGLGYTFIRLRVGDLDTVLGLQRLTIYVYLGVAALLYLASVICLVHSFRTVTDATEHNQVKWILFGALAALLPISYSLYVAVCEPDAFGGGAATWPMFAASVCYTLAFAISITRYRLMELDKLISSGVIYFLISFLAGLVYYAVVFIGTLVFNQVIAGPSLTHALTASTTALVLMLALDLARNRFKKALDHRFSRQKLQLDRTLQRMGQAIEQLVDPPTLAQRFLQASAELLGVSRGAVYLREGDPPIYRLTGCLGPAPGLTELSSGCPLIEALRSGEAVQSYNRDSLYPLAVSPARRQLRHLGGEVAQALAHEGKLLALLVLGPRDQEPYRAEELNLLRAFAQITVLALESATGHRTIDMLNRDLQAKVEKISEQQRRILALQTQLRKQSQPPEPPAAAGGDGAELAGPLVGGIIGSSQPVRHLLELVRKVSASDAVVLIRGETGTGKELLARALHEHSSRASNDFVRVHCAGLSQGLLESELFGHVKGAFTGAHRDRVGRFEKANGGTLLLDEIGDISLEVQTKLLRVLQEKTIERVGSSEPVQVDVRIIAATHQNLEQLIREGRFREDLYYRLNVISIPVPPLRERREDVPELALYFLRRFGSHKGVTQIDDDALAILKGHRWEGNIRELESVIQQAVVMAEESVITVRELPRQLIGSAQAASGWPRSEKPNGVVLADLEPAGLKGEREEYDRHDRERLVRALAAADGNKARAARALGLARSTLVSRLKKYGLS